MFIDFANKYNFDIVYMMPIWGGQQIEENIYIENDFNIMSELSDKISIAERKAREYGINFFHSIPLIKKEKVLNKMFMKENKQKEVGENQVDKQILSKEQNHLFCYLPWQQLNVDPGGDVRPGCLCSKHVGNVEKDSILSIWNNEQMQEYRKRIINNPSNWCNIDCINNVIKMDLKKV